MYIIVNVPMESQGPQMGEDGSRSCQTLETEHEEGAKHLTAANSALLATAYSRPLEAKNAP